jgi:hypothetical protein
MTTEMAHARMKSFILTEVRICLVPGNQEITSRVEVKIVRREVEGESPRQEFYGAGSKDSGLATIAWL